ncbi:hypothetical protein OAP32_00395 [Crocinitomicaceae bacterium]|nr:hypothetical protein [Crocinitomicaceae bacterium]
MAGIKDISQPTNSNGGTVTQVVAVVHYGNVIGGVPALYDEPFTSFDDAVQFAGPLAQAGTQDILYIEYAGLKFGVNL